MVLGFIPARDIEEAEAGFIGFENAPVVGHELAAPVAIECGSETPKEPAALEWRGNGTYGLVGPARVASDDPVGHSKVAEARFVASLSADLGQRIDAYFSAREGLPDQLRLSARPNVFARLRRFVAELAGSRRSYRAAPPASV